MREIKKISIKKHIQIVSEIKKIAEAYSKVTEILNFEEIMETDFKKFKYLEYAIADVKLYMDNRIFKENPDKDDINNIYRTVSIINWLGKFDKKGFPEKQDQDYLDDVADDDE